MTERRLENIAIFYLQRFGATAAQLRRVLMRRVDRALKVHPAGSASRADMAGWVEALIGRLVASGAVDDAAYAAGRAAALRRLGKGPGRIRAALAAKGVDAATIARVLAETDLTAAGEDAELIAARAYVRRRRLGPYRDGPRDAVTARKDLGALARAGFSLDAARKALAEEPEP
jgi:regulatory protein